MTLGTITNVAMENLMAQMDALSQKTHGFKLKPVEPGEIAVVAVAPGAGIARHFAELGAAAIVEGGQSMNPSTADILSSFENLPTDKVIVLPNNKNIAMAAKASAELTVKKVRVIPSNSVPQGLASMLRLDPKGDLDQVAEEMTKATKQVQTGEVTTATRNVEIDGVKVKIGQLIGLHNGKLVTSAADFEKGCLKLLKKIGLENYEIITLFYGQDVRPEMAEEIAAAIRKAYPKQEIETHEGGQPHYQFIFAIE
jgi:dihydroxyacetone kinase-like predicted kinase